MSCKALSACVFSLLLLAGTALAQTWPDPVGTTDPSVLPLAQIPRIDAPPLDRPAIDVEDAQRAANGLMPRYAIPTAVNVTPATHGTWENIGQDRALWRLRVRAPGASHINLGFARYALPASAQLRIYSSDARTVVRPFDQRDNSEAAELWTPVVLSEEIVIELTVAREERNAVLLGLTQIGSGYRFFGAGPTAVPSPEGGGCNVDVACPSALPWIGEVASVAAISTGGFVFCTGFMVNNTAQNGRNFFMTAYHCGIRSSNSSSLVAYWNYQNTACNGGGANFSKFNTGAVTRAGHPNSDFTLVEFNNPPNPIWGVSYAGWDRSGSTGASAVTIHHPSGCPKKISFENQPPLTTSYGGTSVPGDGTHVRVVDWDTGTVEPGSSGCPLFTQNHQVIGQLHGGFSACGNNLSVWYGKFSRSWIGATPSTRLSNWLDPTGTGALTLNTLGGLAPGSWTTFGQGCPGSGPLQGFCMVSNPQAGTLSGITQAAEIAYFVGNSATMQVTGFDFYMRSTTGGNVTINAYLYTGIGQPAAVPSAQTTLTVGPTPDHYRATFAQPLTVTGSFFIAIDNSAQTTVLGTLTSGAFGLSYSRPTPLSGAWSTPSVAAVSYKIACQGGAASPVPQIGNNGVAFINNSFDVTLSLAPPNTLALLILGFSKQSWSGGALPFALPNAPGCDLLVSADDWTAAFTTGTGDGKLTLSVPNNPALVGLTVFHQWLVADQLTNGLGFVVSGAAESKIGG